MAETHRDLDLLLAYAGHQLNEADRALAEQLLARDPAARAVVALWRQASADHRADDGETPPAEAMGRLRAIARAAAPTASWLDRAAALVANLVFDSRAQAIAVRRTEAPTSIQLAFVADDLETEITIERQPSAAGSNAIVWRVSGQVSGDAPTARRLAACAAGTRTAQRETIVDETGWFSLDLEPGRYDLLLDLGDRTLLIADVDVP